MKKVRIGIIGYGNIGTAHAQAIASGKIDGLKLAAICDRNESRLDAAKQFLPGVPLFESYEDLLTSGLADAVLIALPHIDHPPVAIAAFDKGLHVLTEKPAGVYTAQVERMNEAARQSGKVFGIMFNQRINPLHRQVRDLIRSGRLGEIKRLVYITTKWYRTQSYYDSGGWRGTWEGEGGGVLINQACHNLDLWQWFLGIPTRLRAFCHAGKYHHIEVEDDVTIYAEYPNGATATFITSTGEYPGTNQLEIAGDRGKIVLEEGKLRFWELIQSEREFCYSNAPDMEKLKFTYQEILSKEKDPGHAGILQNFTNAILYGEELIAPGYDGINELTLSNGAYLSSWIDDWVELPINCTQFLSELQKRVKDSPIKESGENRDFFQSRYRDRWKVQW